MRAPTHWLKAALLIAAGALLAACTTTNKMSAHDFVLPQQNAKIVILTPNADMALITAGGIREARADWTETAKANLVAAFQSELKTKNVDVMMQDATFEVDGQVLMLSETVMINAIVQGPGYSSYTLPTKKETFDWTMGQTIQPVREKYDADYAMFVYCYGNFASAGNIAMQVIVPLIFGAVNIPQTQQVNTLISLVDLKDGDLVWVDQRIGGDVRDPDAARELVANLLKRLPVEGTKTAPKPPAAKPAAPVAGAVK